MYVDSVKVESGSTKPLIAPLAVKTAVGFFMELSTTGCLLAQPDSRININITIVFFIIYPIDILSSGGNAMKFTTLTMITLRLNHVYLKMNMDTHKIN